MHIVLGPLILLVAFGIPLVRLGKALDELVALNWILTRRPPLPDSEYVRMYRGTRNPYADGWGDSLQRVGLLLRRTDNAEVEQRRRWILRRYAAVYSAMFVYLTAWVWLVVTLD